MICYKLALYLQTEFKSISMELTFDNLPTQVSQINDRLDKIEKLLKQQNNNKPESNEDDLLTVKEAAQFLHLSVPTVYSKCQRRELPYIKPNGSKRLYFSKNDLLNWMKGNKRKSHQDIEEKADEYIK